MHEISLDRLRGLRGRASNLLERVTDDLQPFVKSDGTFRRLPDSRDVPKDTNVTTTCSCVMALTATDTLKSFYSRVRPTPPTPEGVFRALASAPWMSSGLSNNNAFTTSLVLRVYGHLRSGGHLSQEASFQRRWENRLSIKDPLALAGKLSNQGDATALFLWRSLSPFTRDGVTKGLPTNSLENKVIESLATDLRKIIESGWIYGGDRFPNASTATKAILAKAPLDYDLVVVNRQLLSDEYPNEIPLETSLDLSAIADAISQSSKNFTINSYPASAAVVYWFVDGISRAKIQLNTTNWDNLCAFATQEFNHKRSLVVAQHNAMMDPVAMAMAACLCARLRRICSHSECGASNKHQESLPSMIELEHAVRALIAMRTSSGIWHKYFPLFHYQDAGSNFCFAFELLEAILCEFGHGDNHLLEDESFVAALEEAIGWCEENRLKAIEGTAYAGWNSGGQLQSLERSQPESWATAVVHMFLSELKDILAAEIQKKVLKKYRVSTPARALDQDSAIGGLLDIEISLPGEDRSLAEILSETIVRPHQAESPVSLRRKALTSPVSALLFGPPGTSKTEVTKAVAADLGWPLVEITPSDFVKGRLENVYPQTSEIFNDLMDLSGVVVLFDEMDALVQTRDGEARLDITSQFLTTMMLPKLTELHDRGRVIFFMATNFQERFDPAIKRAGRFDLLLCMGPPSFDEKLAKLEVFFREKADSAQMKEAKRLISKYVPDSVIRDKLELFTFNDFKAFLKKIGNKNDIGSKLKALGKAGFTAEVESYANYVTIKWDDILEGWPDTNKPKRLSEAFDRGLSLKDFDPKKLTHSLRYLCDRRESRIQH